MYQRYSIPVKETPPEHKMPPKFNVLIDKFKLATMLLGEALHYRLNRKVILSRPCIYGVFGSHFGGFRPIQEKCTACMRCMQEYPGVIKDIIINPEYRRLGDSYFDPAAVWALNREATTGGDIVRGMGYQGPFAGEGFDAMWTDMSEIVRPTRHGKLGTEYIATEVEIGQKPMHLKFDSSGTLLSQSKIVLSPIPIFFDVLRPNLTNDVVKQAILKATELVGSYAIFPVKDYASAEPRERVIPLLKGTDIREYAEALQRAKVVEWEYSSPDEFRDVRETFSSKILAVRLNACKGVEETAVKLARDGADVLHVCANYHGREFEAERPRYIRDLIMLIHRTLVREGLRDGVTLMGSGGIIRAEHVPKAIICGLDLVGVDTVVLQALQARFEEEVQDPQTVHVTIRPFNVEWGAQRLANVMNSWREQLIEIMSAMGMRDVRRLRGEIGRAMMNEVEEREFLRYLNE